MNESVLNNFKQKFSISRRKSLPWCRESFQKVEQLAGRDHGHGLYVGGHVAEDGQEAIEEGLEALMTRGDDLVEDYDLNWKKKFV